MTKFVYLSCLSLLAGCSAQQARPDYALASQRLDQARADLLPPLGATTYPLSRQRLLDLPGGENNSIARELSQLPGVTAGPGGEIHVRGR